MDNSAYYSVAGAGAFAVLLFVWYHVNEPRPYPPGPRGKFLVGNLKDMPSGGNEWISYAEIGKNCGSDIVHFNVLGSHVLVLNSFEAAHDLLDKKGSIYSSRPRLVVLKELRGWDWNLVLMSYGKRFMAHRRVVQQEFSPPVVVERYRPVISKEVVALLGRLLVTPDALVKHLKQMTGAIIMMVTYGHQVSSADDEFVALAEAVRESGEKNVTNNLVEMFPFLRHLPGWFPGAGFQADAVYARQRSTSMRSAPYEMVKKNLASGTAIPSMISRLLQMDDLSTADLDREEFIKNCGGVVYSAGADTTAAALTNFMLAMCLFPEVQETAQREIDRVVGRDRLPTFADRDTLQYTARVVKETLRWKPIAPLGVPHASIEGDEYNGMHIPKGSTVVANLYAILHDPTVYSNPDSFNPNRFAPSGECPEGEPDPLRAVFGFGRRICPGRFFADDSLWLTIASVLQVFIIAKPEGASVTDYENITWTSGIVSMPSPFPFTITPRFPSARDLVRSASENTM